MSKNQLLEFYEELDDSDLEETPSSQKRLFQKRESKKQVDGCKTICPRPGNLARISIYLQSRPLRGSLAAGFPG